MGRFDVDISFTSVLVVAAIAFLAPLLLGLLPRAPLPAVVLELVGGILVGPSVLDWAKVDAPVRTLSLLGLAFLLLLAGLEIDFDRLRGRLLEVAGLGFVLSFGIALAIGFAFDAAGLVRSPLLVAIMLSATSLGVVIPVLKDAGEGGSQLGQLVLAGATIADVATIVLLSLFFSAEAGSTTSRAILLGGFVLLSAAVAFALVGAERLRRLTDALVRLQDTTAQIRVRGAFLLLAAFVVLADRFGVESILGAFIAGAVLKLVDRDRMMTHPFFHRKLEAAGYGVFVPFFFVTAGLQLDIDALDNGSTLARVPLFVAALLAVRALPAVVYRGTAGTRGVVAAGLLQATTLGFLVVAGRIGMDLGLLSEANGAALVAAGLVSVLIFPSAALSVLKGRMMSPRIPVAEGAE
ncbi:MAG TPA: cation:proton antiporter [Gaiellaceae bacterium]|nr:cation:proton antiporter [Gaiellaceae bacterium]